MPGPGSTYPFMTKDLRGFVQEMNLNVHDLVN